MEREQHEAEEVRLRAIFEAALNAAEAVLGRRCQNASEVDYLTAELARAYVERTVLAVRLHHSKTELGVMDQIARDEDRRTQTLEQLRGKKP